MTSLLSCRCETCTVLLQYLLLSMNTTDTSSSIQFPAIIRSMKAVDMYYKSTKNGLTGTRFKNPSYQKGTLYNQVMTYRKCKSTFLLIQKCLPLSQMNILSIKKEQLLLIIVFVFASYGHKAKLMFSTSFKGSKQIMLKKKDMMTRASLQNKQTVPSVGSHC